ncbi:MAG: SDR family oxidoreductase [Pseudomonadota bacterium]
MISDKVAIVTGGGQGIGSSISQALLAKGYQVIIAQRGEPDAALAHATWLATDLTDDHACTQLIDVAIKKHGRLDALINNAGIMLESPNTTPPQDDDSAVATQTIRDAMTQFDRTLAINLRAPYLLSLLALPHLSASLGCIVNIGSIEGQASNPRHSAYGASKAALHALTRGLAVDHGQTVRCNAIAPGWIDTTLNDAFIASMPDPARFRASLGEIHPSGRTGTADEVAALVVFLCSDNASFINGQTITIDGGRTAQLSLPSR